MDVALHAVGTVCIVWVFHSAGVYAIAAESLFLLPSVLNENNCGLFIYTSAYLMVECFSRPSEKQV